MAEEQGKRKRGRRRGRQDDRRAIPPQEEAQVDNISAEDAAPEAEDQPEEAPARPRRRFGRRSRSESPGRGGKEAAKPHVAGSAPAASPVDFWRTSQARTRRAAPAPRKGMNVWQRVSGFHFPPWVPVAFIIVVVFGILGLLFVTRQATGAPRINDHWHANYRFFVCGERQANAPTFEGVGVHTHGDGIVHMHPFSVQEEGSGARLNKWFEYGGGVLKDDEIRMIGSSKTYKNGDKCEDGREGVLQIFVNGQRLQDWRRYNPQDGDNIRIVFGPLEEVEELADETILPPDDTARTVELSVTGNENATAFSPSSITLNTGEIVKVVLTNKADVEQPVSHGLRIRGPDEQYNTTDDFVVHPVIDGVRDDEKDILQPGEIGEVYIRFDDPGQIQFGDPTAVNPDTGEIFDAALGTITVIDTATTPTPSATPAETFDLEVAVAVGAAGFDPAQISIPAGKKFRITITNVDALVHDLRIAGPDGEYRSDDDLASGNVAGGTTGEIVGQIDDPGEYEFRDDFNRELTGTITVTAE